MSTAQRLRQRLQGVAADRGNAPARRGHSGGSAGNREVSEGRVAASVMQAEKMPYHDHQNKKAEYIHSNQTMKDLVGHLKQPDPLLL